MVANLSRFLGSLRLATIGVVVVAAHMIVPLLVPGVAAGTNGPIVVFGGQQYAVSVGADAFESAAYDPVNGRFASRDFLYDACGQAVSAGPEEGPGLAWDAATGYFWQITNDRVVRRWNGGTIVDTVFAIPPTFLVPVSGLDTLEAPKGIALDDDHVYVVDAGPEPGEAWSNAWFKFTRTGTPVKSSKSTNFVSHLDEDPDALVDDIVYSPPGSPIYPGRLLIALEHSGIQVVDTDGNFSAKLLWSSDGAYTGIKPFAFAGLALDPTTGNLFLVDNDGSRCQVWTRLTSTPPRYVVGVSGGHAYLQLPTPGCNRPMWRPISVAANAPSLVFGVAYRPLDGFAYGMDFGSGDLWRFDPLSGAGQLVDATGIDNVWGLAYDTERDVLYAGREWFGDAQIFVVDPDNGAEFDLPNLVGHYLNDLAFNPNDGFIYGMESNTLIRIDRDSGVGSVVGVSSQHGRGLEYDPVTTKLIAVTNTPIKLWSVDPANANTTFIADLQTNTGWEGLATVVLSEVVATPHVAASRPDLRLYAVPNPFDASAAFEIELAASSSATVRVFDSGGRLVRHLFDGVLGPGLNRMQWDGRDDRGRRLSPGVYWIRSETAERVATGRVTLVR